MLKLTFLRIKTTIAVFSAMLLAVTMRGQQPSSALSARGSSEAELVSKDRSKLDVLMSPDFQL
jgi:hypothetical protein